MSSLPELIKSDKLWTSTPFSNVGTKGHIGEDITGRLASFPLSRFVKAEEIVVGKKGYQSVAVKLTMRCGPISEWMCLARHVRYKKDQHSLVPYVDLAAKEAALRANKYGRRAAKSPSFFALHYHFDPLIWNKLSVPASFFVSNRFDSVLDKHQVFGVYTNGSIKDLRRETFFESFRWLSAHGFYPDDTMYTSLQMDVGNDLPWYKELLIDAIWGQESLHHDLMVEEAIIWFRMQRFIATMASDSL